MISYEELNRKINDLEMQDFNYYKAQINNEEQYATNLLRKALLYFNKIYLLEDKKKELELENKLSTIIKNKFKELNPSLSEKVLEDMINCYQRGNICFPLDIYVLHNGVFIKEGVIDDYAEISYTRTQMVEGRYFNIFNELFLFNDSKKFDFELNEISNEKNKEISKFISDSINDVFQKEYLMPITKPLYELNSDRCFYGIRGLVSNVKTLNIYINERYNNIANSIINEVERDFELYVKDQEDISVYKIYQSFKDNKPIWSIKKLDLSIWCLSNEAIKRTQSKSKLVKKLVPLREKNKYYR